MRESRCLGPVSPLVAKPPPCDHFLLTFPVIAKAHFGLSQANGVFPSANTIELLEFGLFDALYNT